MVEPTFRERVDAFWSGTLGIGAAELHTPGTHVYPHPPQRELWRGIYVLDLDGAVTVFAPADYLDKVTTGTAGLDAEQMLTPATWYALLGDAVRAAYGPIEHNYLTDRTGLADIAGGRRINPRDAEALGALRGAVSAAEWAETGFTGQPAMLFGIFDGDRMVAAANLTAGPEAATDIGIVVHPEARGRGLALQIVATAAKQAIAMHGIARFRALAYSKGTRAVANRLGFQPYGRNLAAYLTG